MLWFLVQLGAVRRTWGFAPGGFGGGRLPDPEALARTVARAFRPRPTPRLSPARDLEALSRRRLGVVRARPLDRA